MYCFVISFGYLLGSFILSHARHTVIVSHTGEKSYLPDSSEADVCMTPACVVAAADILTSLDKTVDPCDDFYSFTCGNWMKKQEVTEEEPRVNIFYSASKDLNRKLRDLVESEDKSSDPPFVKILKDFYNTCTDVDTIEELGSKPLKNLLRIIGGGWPVVEGSDWDEPSFDWVDALISLRKLGLDYKILVDFYVSYDPRNATNNIIYFEDPSMGRLSRANLSLGFEDLKVASYYDVMVKAAKLLGADESTAEKEMKEALYFEVDLIQIAQVDESEGRENKTVMTIAELQKELPQIPLLKLINGLLQVEQVDENEPIVNGFNSFLVKFADLIASTDKRVIANYMLWQAVLDIRNYLSQEWEDIIKFEDYGHPKKRKSTKEEPRWKECLMQLKMYFQIPLSSYYVRTHFSDESKDEAMMLMKYIHKEFLKLLENNDWMDEKTKEKAEEKANAIKAYIGYPKELLNDTFVMEVYKGLTIRTDSYLDNVLAINKWNVDKRLSSLRETSDKTERRGMKFASLITVNAFYSPTENSIAIPAGILHDAFYDKDKPEYMNFAEIGYIIGHEITHGFDDEGRHFDKDGKYNSWWDKESDEHFLKKAQCIVDQYGNYTTIIGMNVNGKMTLGENIADNGGVKEAYLAYQSWVEEHGTEPLLPGVEYTQNQLFWLSAARAWCSKYESEKLKEMLLTDVHSPAKFRIIGPMSNLEEFSRDFKCPADSPMNRKYKCEIW